MILVDGELKAGTLTQIYSAPIGATVKMLSLEIVNNSDYTAYLDCYLVINGRPRRIFPVSQELQAGAKLEEDLQRYLPSKVQVHLMSSVGNVTYILQIEEPV